MPSPLIAEIISQSLQPGERYEDVAFMVDAIANRREIHAFDSERSENMTGILICLIIIDKPEEYKKDVQKFRMRFSGIADNTDLQEDFINRIHHEALLVNHIAEIQWDAGRYFNLSPDSRLANEF